MTTILNASTSAGLIITPDTSGNIQLQYNGVAAPAFNVGLSSNQNVSATTWTKIQFNSEFFDTASCYDNTTNYRFTPTVAGYYQLYAQAAFNGTVTGSYINIYKNGTSFQRRQVASDGMPAISTLVYLNGTTDYAETYVYVYGTPSSINGNSTETYFNGCLLRGA